MIPEESRMRALKAGFTRALEALFVAMLGAAVAAEAAWQEGDALVDLGGFVLEGDAVPDLSGKVVLIDFWATWCAPCKASFPVMIELAERYGAEGFVVLAVSVDKKPGPFDAWRERYGASLVMVRDVDQKLVREAAIEAMPTSFIVDRGGRIVKRHAGFHAGETEALYAREILDLLSSPASPSRTKR